MAEKTIKEAMEDFIVGYALPEYIMQYPNSTPIEQDDYVKYLILTILQEQGPDIENPVRPFQTKVVKNKKGEVLSEVPMLGSQPERKKPGFQPGRGLTQYNEDFLVEAKRLKEIEDRKNKVPGYRTKATPNPELMKEVLKEMWANKSSEGALSDVEEYETLSRILPLMRKIRTFEEYKDKPEYEGRYIEQPWQQVEAVQKAGKSRMDGGEFGKNLVEKLLKEFTKSQLPPEEPESYIETVLRTLGFK